MHDQQQTSHAAGGAAAVAETAPPDTGGRARLAVWLLVTILVSMDLALAAVVVLAGVLIVSDLHDRTEEFDGLGVGIGVVLGGPALAGGVVVAMMAWGVVSGWALLRRGQGASRLRTSAAIIVVAMGVTAGAALLLAWGSVGSQAGLVAAAVLAAPVPAAALLLSSLPPQGRP